VRSFKSLFAIGGMIRTPEIRGGCRAHRRRPQAIHKRPQSRKDQRRSQFSRAHRDRRPIQHERAEIKCMCDVTFGPMLARKAEQEGITVTYARATDT
jgi:hypothetical protein